MRALLLGLACLAACDAAPAPSAQPQAAATPPAAAAPAFPAPARPVAEIVTNRFSNEDARDRVGEAEKVIELAGIAPGQNVADIGAGEGYYTLRLSRVVGPNGRVLAEDVVPRYARALEERVDRARLDNVEVVLGTPDDPRLPPESLDRALLIHMYHEIEQPYALMWRLHGAMRPGGLVGIVDADRPTSQHGTPPALLRCEVEAVGYTQVAFHDLGEAGGYLALFAPANPRPEPSAIRPCRQ